MNIEITPEERKSILQYFILIRSYGTDTAEAYYNFWQSSQEYYSGVYSASKKIEVFKPVEVVMEKIIDEIDYGEFPEEFHDNNQEYYNISINFNTKQKTIEVSGSFTVNDVEESFEEYEIDEDKLEIFEDFLQRGVSEIICTYNGGGDSGYIDNDMSVDGEREQISASIEDMCYNALSSFGGWEINEGSQGNIVFNLEDKTITINHEWNTEEPINFEITKIQI